MSKKRQKTPEEQFDHELSSVFIRWWEESDLDELEMSRIAIEVTERFCDTTVDFESNIDLSDMDDDE
jgi:hypothetical protein|tara:strand:+ start:41 stop:241 length:201 start_codon:yes stop_codon:yes gene_type:complete